MEDSIHHRQLRQVLVEKLREKGITDDKVLQAIGRVPRHLFLDPGVPAAEAYADKALEIDAQQTISQPYTVAYQTELLKLGGDEKVLEIGTGSGYQAAVLFEAGARVYSIERHSILYNKTKLLLAQLGYSAIKLRFGDGYQGMPGEAPFDRIIVTAAASSVPEELAHQLKYGGTMVLPLNGNIQQMICARKDLHGNLSYSKFGKFLFVPMLHGTE